MVRDAWLVKELWLLRIIDRILEGRPWLRTQTSIEKWSEEEDERLLRIRGRTCCDSCRRPSSRTYLSASLNRESVKNPEARHELLKAWRGQLEPGPLGFAQEESWWLSCMKLLPSPKPFRTCQGQLLRRFHELEPEQGRLYSVLLATKKRVLPMGFGKHWPHG